MKILLASLVLLASLISIIMADEPLWTDEQRLAERDVVTVATVISTQKVSNIDQHNDLFLAVLKVEGMKKGMKTSVGSIFRVYYEFSPTGKNIRCPKYAELTEGMRATFFLRVMTEDIQKHIGLKKAAPNDFFLEMGSDVKKEQNTEPESGPVRK